VVIGVAGKDHQIAARDFVLAAHELANRSDCIDDGRARRVCREGRPATIKLVRSSSSAFGSKAAIIHCPSYSDGLSPDSCGAAVEKVERQRRLQTSPKSRLQNLGFMSKSAAGWSPLSHCRCAILDDDRLPTGGLGDCELGDWVAKLGGFWGRRPPESFSLPLVPLSRSGSWELDASIAPPRATPMLGKRLPRGGAHPTSLASHLGE
jgi:hypothetical protein